MTRKPYVVTNTELTRRSRCYLDQVGLYAITLTKGGVEVAAEVRYGPTPDEDFPDNDMSERPHYWTVWANGLLHRGPSVQIDWMIIGRRITKDEFDWLIEDRQWAKAWDPQSAEANPHKRVDVNLLAPPKFV